MQPGDIIIQLAGDDGMFWDHVALFVGWGPAATTPSDLGIKEGGGRVPPQISADHAPSKAAWVIDDLTGRYRDGLYTLPVLRPMDLGITGAAQTITQILRFPTAFSLSLEYLRASTKVPFPERD
jgi:hypothetical protein